MRKISEDKKKNIDITKFECKRLKEVAGDNEIKVQIEHFLSEKNHNLGGYLHYHARTEESANYRAFYVILDDKDIVLYFSLQMGATIKCHKKYIGGIKYDTELERTHIDKDKIEVTNVVPVIEIPQFCVNDRYRNKVKSWKVEYKGIIYNVGQFVFFKYMVPIVLDVAEKVGFQYLILFCADNAERDLEKYYKTMGFERMDNMACLRDEYSKDLECLIVKIDELIERYLKFEDPFYVSPNPKKLKYNNWTFFPDNANAYDK